MNRHRDIITKHVDMTEKARIRLGEKNGNEHSVNKNNAKNEDDRETTSLKNGKYRYSFRGPKR